MEVPEAVAVAMGAPCGPAGPLGSSAVRDAAPKGSKRGFVALEAAGESIPKERTKEKNLPASLGNHL